MPRLCEDKTDKIHAIVT